MSGASGNAPDVDRIVIHVPCLGDDKADGNVFPAAAANSARRRAGLLCTFNELRSQVDIGDAIGLQSRRVTARLEIDKQTDSGQCPLEL